MEKKATILSVTMGYGHQRTAHNLKNLGRLINVNDDLMIPRYERMIWRFFQNFYHSISSFKSFPIVGNIVFGFFNYFQRIEKFYPKRELTKPTLYLKNLYFLMKRGWGKEFIFKLKENPKPIISTFFIPAFMAEVWDYPEEIFCVVCDADISRAWAPLISSKSRIKYFVPTSRSAERLMMYGVKKENIFFTGYPLPTKQISLNEFKKAFLKRILNLDPQHKILDKYRCLIEEKIGSLPDKNLRPLTFLFSVGGAGAQKEMALLILNSLQKKIVTGDIQFIISVGTNEKVNFYFQEKIKKMFSFFPENIKILFQKDIHNYFEEFNQLLLEADILITKPSELSFYSALGIPLLILPPIGYQEEFNKDWLLKNHFAIEAKKLEYFSDWFFDFLNEGFFAKCAISGFIDGKKEGTDQIEKIISGK